MSSRNRGASHSPKSGRSGSGSPKGGGSPRSRRRNRKNKQRSAEEEEALAAWYPPSRAQLKSLVSGRHFRAKDFSFHECLGTGTFACVRLVILKHRDEDEAEVPPMAIKTMKKFDLLQLQQVDHVKTEKTVLDQMDNKFVVTLLSTFQDERRIFFLLELVHGGELYNRLRLEGRLPIDHCKFYAAEMLLALRYIHSLDVVYRDIKPENILLDKLGHIKVVDFGFAKIVRENELAYTLVGTPEYLAPELIQAGNDPPVGHGKEVDFWALGVVIYEMVCGYPPFFDQSPFGIYKKIMNLEYEFPRHFDVKAKNLVRHLLTRSMEKRFNLIDCFMHLWFDHIDWTALNEQTFRPPYRPRVEGAMDMRNFELVEDSQAQDAYQHCPPITRKENKYFVDLF